MGNYFENNRVFFEVFLKPTFYIGHFGSKLVSYNGESDGYIFEIPPFSKGVRGIFR